MKILFTADLHLKLGQKGVPVEWSLNRYNLLFKKLKEIQTSYYCDQFIVGGDIFDKVPSMDELEVYTQFLSCIKIPTFIYPGNHEATKKGKTFFTHLKGMTSLINPRVTVLDDYYTQPGFYDIIPYNKLKEFDPTNFKERILFTHVRGEIPPHVKPEVDLELFDHWDLVLAGDLHSYENSQRNILYPGSPVTTSFHRSEVETGVIILDTDSLQHEWVRLDLPQLLRKTIKNSEDAVKTDYHHTLYEIEGDLSKLGTMETSDIIDRKVLKRSSETALMLDPHMSMEEEIVEYLKYILMVDDSTVEKVLKEYGSTKHLI